MELPKRKPNRLAGYDYDRPGGYFVTICIKGRENLLGEVVGADVLIGPQIELSPIGEIVYDVLAQMPTVGKFIVMPNHVHAIVHIPGEDGAMRTSPPTQSLEMVVRYFKRAVTKRCGRSIWQRSFHDHIIRDEEDYLRIWQYIDTNPAKWEEDCYYTEVET